jgi:hypothetical protein
MKMAPPQSRAVADELPRNLVEDLSTPELPMERGETTVGQE